MKVFGHYVYLPIALLVAAELLIGGGVFVGCALLLDATSTSAGPLTGDALVFAAVSFTVAMVVGITAVGLYQAKQRLRIEGVLARIVVALGIAAVYLALVEFFFSVGFGGPVWISSFALAAALLGVERTMLDRWLEHEAFQRTVLVYGSGKRAASLLKLRRRSDRRGFKVAAFVPAEGDEQVFDDGRVVPVSGSLLDFAKTQGVDEIVIAMDDRRRGFPIRDLLDCKFAGIGVIELLSFLERETGKVNVDLVNPTWLIFSDGFGARPRLQAVTRIVDLVAALTLLIVALPLMVLVAAAILVDDGRPVFYRQRRVGLSNSAFTLLKFRSMVRDAEAAGSPQWAKTGDSRVTRVGGVVRKLRLDELPQLFNVIVGDMSLVGPRPERPEFVDRLSQRIPYYHERHIVKPGITGWAQLSYPYGSSDSDALEKLQYDLYYIKYKSLIFDLMVLLQTAEVVLWGKGAR